MPSPSPVLQEIGKLLVPTYQDLFDGDILRCLGTVKRDGGQQCKRMASDEAGRETANRLLKAFALHDHIPDGESFHGEVRQFLTLIHCNGAKHADAALERFETWRLARSAPDSSAASTTAAAVSGRPPPPPRRAGQARVTETPRKASVNTADARDFTPATPATPATTASRALSPGCESDGGFSRASPASTAITNITTPGLTPADAKPDPYLEGETGLDDDDDDDDDAESRPATPTPAPRKPRAPTPPGDLDEEVSELQDVFAALGFVEVGPEILGTILQRSPIAGDQKKWQYLRAIESAFTKLDCREGRVYVWKHTSDARLVKIGFTERSSAARRKDSRNCAAKDTEVHWESEEPFVGARKVEKIVMVQLRQWNVALVRCNRCQGRHTEWFENDAEKVKALLQDWTRFVQMAYRDGRLSREGERLIEGLCDDHLHPGKLVSSLQVISDGDDELSAQAGGPSTPAAEAPVGIPSRGKRVVAESGSGLSSAGAGSTLPATRSKAKGGQKETVEPQPQKKGWKDRAKAKATRGFLHKTAPLEDLHAPHSSGDVKPSNWNGGREDEDPKRAPKLLRWFHSIESKQSKETHSSNEPGLDNGGKHGRGPLARRVSTWIPVQPRRARTLSWAF